VYWFLPTVPSTSKILCGTHEICKFHIRSGDEKPWSRPRKWWFILPTSENLRFTPSKSNSTPYSGMFPLYCSPTLIQRKLSPTQPSSLLAPLPPFPLSSALACLRGVDGTKSDSRDEDLCQSARHKRHSNQTGRVVWALSGVLLLLGLSETSIYPSYVGKPTFYAIQK